MKCVEVRELASAFVDSELDAWTTLEVQQHLASCPECARVFAQEQQLSLQLRTSLNRGTRTEALWEHIEASLRRPQATSHPASSQRNVSAHPDSLSVPGSWSRLILKIRSLPSLRAWAGIATAWVVIVSLHFSAREAEPTVTNDTIRPSELRLAFAQQRVLLGELTASAETEAKAPPGASKPGPQSRIRNVTPETSRAI